MTKPLAALAALLFFAVAIAPPAEADEVFWARYRPTCVLGKPRLIWIRDATSRASCAGGSGAGGGIYEVQCACRLGAWETLTPQAIDAPADEECLTWEGSSSAPEWQVCAGGGGSGTVTSVDLTAPAEISVAGAPVTTSGTIALTWATQAANRIFSGPSSGGGAAPSFRALTDDDVPDGITISLAAQATALAANGSNCTAGNYPLGVDASGAVETCTALPADDDVPEAGDFGALALTGDVTSVGLATTIAGNSIALGTDTVGGYAASASEGGPATTALALDVNPADCGPNEYAFRISALGNLSCTTLSDADIPDTITVTLAATASALATNPTACSAGDYVDDIAADGTLSCSTPAGGTGLTHSQVMARLAVGGGF